MNDTRPASATLISALLSPYEGHVPPDADLSAPEHLPVLRRVVLRHMSQHVHLIANSLSSLHGCDEHVVALRLWATLGERVSEVTPETARAEA